MQLETPLRPRVLNNPDVQSLQNTRRLSQQSAYWRGLCQATLKLKCKCIHSCTPLKYTLLHPLCLGYTYNLSIVQPLIKSNQGLNFSIGTFIFINTHFHTITFFPLGQFQQLPHLVLLNENSRSQSNLALIIDATASTPFQPWKAEAEK